MPYTQASPESRQRNLSKKSYQRYSCRQEYRLKTGDQLKLTKSDIRILTIAIFSGGQTMNAGKELAKTLKFLMFAVLSQLLFACSSAPTKSYEGEERNLEDVAVIMNGISASSKYKFSQKGILRQGFSRTSGYVMLMKIDGVTGENGDLLYFHSAMNGGLNVAVLPGEHTLTTYFRSSERTLLTTVRDAGIINHRFNAEKGHTYLLSFLQNDNHWTPVLLDLTAWKKVYPAEELKPIKGAIMGPGIQEWVKGTPIRPISESGK